MEHRRSSPSIWGDGTIKKKRAIESGDGHVSREAGMAEVCSECNGLRLRFLPWFRRSRRQLGLAVPGEGPDTAVSYPEHCQRCGMTRLRLWRELREDELGRVKRRGPPFVPIEDELLAAARERPSLRPAFVRVFLTVDADQLRDSFLAGHTRWGPCGRSPRHQSRQRLFAV